MFKKGTLVFLLFNFMIFFSSCQENAFETIKTPTENEEGLTPEMEFGAEGPTADYEEVTPFPHPTPPPPVPIEKIPFEITEDNEIIPLEDFEEPFESEAQWNDECFEECPEDCPQQQSSTWQRHPSWHQQQRHNRNQDLQRQQRTYRQQRWHRKHAFKGRL